LTPSLLLLLQLPEELQGVNKVLRLAAGVQLLQESYLLKSLYLVNSLLIIWYSIKRTTHLQQREKGDIILPV
jgi:hypothetical protein